MSCVIAQSITVDMRGANLNERARSGESLELGPMGQNGTGR